MSTPSSAGEGHANIYHQGNIDDEWERLRALSFPTECSLEALGDPSGLTVLDVGAGVNTLLGDAVIKAGGSYTATDISPEALAAQRAHGHPAEFGAIADLPFEANAFDIAHARFVLCHQANHEQRVDAIRELVRTSTKRVLLLEHVGRAAGGTPAVDRWMRVLEQVGQHPDIPFEPFMELLLADESAQAADDGCTLDVRVFERPPGMHYGELIRGGESLFLRVVRGFPELEAQLAEANEALKTEAATDPQLFKMPDLIAVTIDRRNDLVAPQGVLIDSPATRGVRRTPQGGRR